MRNWWLFFIAAAVVVGCAGTGGTGTTTPPTGTTGGGGRDVPTVNLARERANVQVLFLSGQGRRAVGSQIATVTNLRVQNDVHDFAPSGAQGSLGGIRVTLDGYTFNGSDFNVAFPRNSMEPRIFRQFPLTIAAIDEQTTGGVSRVFSGGFTVSPPLPVNVAVYPGRQTTMQVRLNDAILGFDPATGLRFDRDQFLAENNAPGTAALESFLSDYIGFDLSAMAGAARPKMANGLDADYVLFTGDSIAISAGFDGPDTFNLLNPIVVQEGTIRPTQFIAGQEAPGQFTILEPDPRDPLGGGRPITALQGTWRPYTSALGNLSDFAMVVFPNSRNSNEQQVVAWNMSGGAITALWQGVVRYSSATGGTIDIWSVSQVADATARDIATGTIRNFERRGGVVVAGDFEFATPPAGFPFRTSGSFAVFR